MFLGPDNWAERKLREIQADGQSKNHPYVFMTSCVQALGEDIDKMKENEREVSYAEMAEHCDLSKFAERMGYDEDFPLAKDEMVSYWQSTYQGHPCYFLDHSRIEYIWVQVEGWHPKVVKAVNP